MILQKSALEVMQLWLDIAPYARDDHYSPVQLWHHICKQEKGADLAKWLEIVFSTWKHTH